MEEMKNSFKLVVENCKNAIEFIIIWYNCL